MGASSCLESHEEFDDGRFPREDRNWVPDPIEGFWPSLLEHSNRTIIVTVSNNGEISNPKMGVFLARYNVWRSMSPVCSKGFIFQVLFIAIQLIGQGPMEPPFGVFK